jgi:hypothetical protein
MNRGLFVLLLVGAVSCKRIVDPKAVLAEIDDSHMGKTLLNTIQIGLASGSPIHEIQSYINNIRFMVESE